MITIAPRLFLNLQDGWHHTVIDLPEERWRREFDDQVFGSGPDQIGDVLHTFPVGLLSKMEQTLLVWGPRYFSGIQR